MVKTVIRSPRRIALVIRPVVFLPMAFLLALCLGASSAPAARARAAVAAPPIAAPIAAAPAEPNAPSAISIVPNPATVVANGTQLFTATVSAASVTWSADPAAGSILSTGPLTAVLKVTTTAGTYPNAITATSSSHGSAGATVNVIPGPLASIAVSPPAADLVVDTTRDFSATGTDAFGNPINGLSVVWSVAPAAGSIASSGPATMTFRAGTTPGNYPEAIRATSGAIAGTANIFVRAGPPASVVVTPSAVTMDINATQDFTATVFDRFGNPRPELGVTWLTPPFDGSPVGTIETSSALNARFRAGTRAGTFAGGLQASQPPGLGSATITIRPGPPARVQLTANPGELTTDGVSSSTIVATVTDEYGNPIGAGVPVAFEVTQCAGVCELSPRTGTTNGQSRLATVLRSIHTSPTRPLTSTIRVVASASGNAANGSVDVLGSFTPYRRLLPAVIKGWPPDNHTACTAFRIVPPATLSQPASNAFNIYRFTAAAPFATVIISNYATDGQLLLYLITADNCATNNTMSLSFIRSATIAQGTSTTTFSNALLAGQQYLLAVNTTGALTNQFYTLTLTQ